MSAPSLLTRRAASVCFSCRRNLLRQRPFSTSPASLIAAFQAYTLPSQPPPAPRNVSVPDTSITTPIDSPIAIPKIQSTRPPAPSPAVEETESVAQQGLASVPEREAQQSKREFAAAAAAGTGKQGLPEQTQQQQTQKQPETENQPPTTTASSTSPSTAQTPTKPTSRPRSRLRARKAAITITPQAVSQLRALVDQPEPKLIKVGVRNRGCSGLAYHLEYVDKPGSFDETVEQDGVQVLIDSKALFSIIGSEMDWVEDKLSQRFVFRNPNIKEQCGCGESFMV
ncbi:uncharacterized protein C8A04DRAFT_13860 [Dichotomopilus funicola]|uniref:Iron-sulfur assembly protein 1 n=1 Tax=Dichotomopilus funicola TaxID=1934379 RepID=A0AAN6ZKZ3_9PEZI|nr:hypothetical protein C8A04DRAFT_13860 [Dichotomopilus funicola]